MQKRVYSPTWQKLSGCTNKNGKLCYFSYPVRDMVHWYNRFLSLSRNKCNKLTFYWSQIDFLQTTSVLSSRLQLSARLFEGRLTKGHVTCVFQKKMRDLCQYYVTLIPCDRATFLKTLAVDFAVDHSLVLYLANNLSVAQVGGATDQ